MTLIHSATCRSSRQPLQLCPCPPGQWMLVKGKSRVGASFLIWPIYSLCVPKTATFLRHNGHAHESCASRGSNLWMDQMQLHASHINYYSKHSNAHHISITHGHIRRSKAHQGQQFLDAADTVIGHHVAEIHVYSKRTRVHDHS